MIALFLALAALFCSALIIFMILPFYANKEKFSEKKTVLLGAILFLALASSLMYYKLGDGRGVYNKIIWQQLESTQVNAHDQMHVPKYFIDSLEMQLQQHPNNGMNWILLGRIYFSAQDYHDAAQAFKKAYTIYPEDADILIEYATSLYFAGENNTQEWESVLMKVAALSPQTTTSLSLLANIAFEAGDHAQALIYWKTILSMTPPNSPLHQTLQKTIDEVNLKNNIHAIEKEEQI